MHVSILKALISSAKEYLMLCKLVSGTTNYFWVNSGTRVLSANL